MSSNASTPTTTDGSPLLGAAILWLFILFLVYHFSFMLGENQGRAQAQCARMLETAFTPATVRTCAELGVEDEDIGVLLKQRDG